MALSFHYSPRLGAWARCQAQTRDACLFGGDSHGDRTSIADHHGGGVLSYRQDGVIEEFTVTPVIQGMYGVINRDGDTRTYTADGVLIGRLEREPYLRDVILPRVRARHLARLRSERCSDIDGVDGGAGEFSSSQSTVLELPTSVLTIPAVRPGPAGRAARAEQVRRDAEATPTRGLPTSRQAARQQRERRREMAARLRGLFRRQAREPGESCSQPGRFRASGGRKRPTPGPARPVLLSLRPDNHARAEGHPWRRGLSRPHDLGRAPRRS